MDAVRFAAIAAAAYLIGSVPWGYVLVRLFRKQDIRATGSGNIGATNVVRSGAKGLGALTFLLDALKGWAAVALAASLMGSPGQAEAAALAGMCALVGHIFPVWLGFRGGKGVATAFGVFLALAWKVALLSLLTFLVALVAFRIVSLASILAAAVIPPLAFLLPPHAGRGWPVLLALAAGPSLVVWKHSANIRRLLAGTEYRFGAKRPAAA